MYPIHPIARPVTALTDLAAIRHDAHASNPHRPNVAPTACLAPTVPTSRAWTDSSDGSNPLN